VNAHQVIANRMPCRRARTTWAAARTNHSSANPRTGTPYRTAKTPKPRLYGSATTPGATSATYGHQVRHGDGGRQPHDRTGAEQHGVESDRRFGAGPVPADGDGTAADRQEGIARQP
jgi:hypothetical protein